MATNTIVMITADSFAIVSCFISKYQLYIVFEVIMIKWFN